MPGTQNEYRAAEFDENGNDIDGDEAAAVADEAEVDEEAGLDDGAAPEEGAEAAGAAKGKKYRIGDQEFDTADEALAYSQQQQQIADAYRQGIQDSAIAGNPAASATPAQAPAEEFDQTLYYENPQEFLKQFENKITSKVTQTVAQQNEEKEVADRVWGQFVSRHPELADFRREVDAKAGEYLDQLRAISKTKGANAGFDFVALKVKADFARYANATKQQRTLANTRQANNPGAGGGVTLTKTKQKSLSFMEQVRSIRPKR